MRPKREYSLVSKRHNKVSPIQLKFEAIVPFWKWLHAFLCFVVRVLLFELWWFKEFSFSDNFPKYLNLWNPIAEPIQLLLVKKNDNKLNFEVKALTYEQTWNVTLIFRFGDIIETIITLFMPEKEAWLIHYLPLCRTLDPSRLCVLLSYPSFL